MAEVVIVGGALCGSAAAMLLGRDGHQVTVLERDPEPPPADPDEAWARWTRRGVTQFRLAHIYLPRFRHLLEAELPEAIAALEAAGALRTSTLGRPPPSIADFEPEPADDRFEMVTGRRSTVELVLAEMAEQTPGVTVRRGVAVDGLVAGPSAGAGVPHVVGVRTSGGETVNADVVVDAGGRRSALPRLLSELGGPAPSEEAEDSGFAYFGRYFHRAAGMPEALTPPLTPIDSMSVLTLPADNDTYSVTLYASAADAPLRRFRDPEVYERVIRACPLHAHWLDGTPIGDLATMTSVVDRKRIYVRDGTPVVTGIVPVGDAWACTNPSVGRGSSLALLHCVRLRHVLAEGIDDPVELALRWDADTRANLEPWHDATLQGDRRRSRQIEAAIAGGQPDVDPEDPVEAITDAFERAVPHSADAFRGFLAIASVLELPMEVIGRPGFVERLVAAAEGHEPPRFPGPTRQELLELVA